MCHRQVARLEPYHFNLYYKPGNQNPADPLSFIDWAKVKSIIVKALLDLAQMDCWTGESDPECFDVKSKLRRNQTIYDVKNNFPMLLALCYVTSQCNLQEVMTSCFRSDADDLYIFLWILKS